MTESNRKPEQANRELPGSASIPQPAVDPSTGRIACDLPCVACEYNLRTLRADGLCPECGKEVMDSVRKADPTIVHFHWLNMLKNGFDFLFWGILLFSAVTLATCVLAASGISGSTLLSAVLLGSGLFGLLMLAIGAFLVIGPHPPSWTGQRLQRTRSVFFAAISAVLMLFIFLVVLASLWRPEQSLGLLCIAFAGIIPIAFGSYCRQLARRGSEATLRKAATIAVWATVACITALTAGSFGVIIDRARGVGPVAELGSAFLTVAIIVFIGGLPLWTIVFFKLRRMLMDELKRLR